jgi:hydrophobic/amphiphilic exporter-1 (mainly G- bacteria), HAE1 family
MYVAKKTWFFWHAAVRRMPSDREHAFFQGGKSTSYEHVCLVTANSGAANNLYTQIGLMLLIALSAKNGILIVEVARERRMVDGKPIMEAAVEASRTRFRPILMTSFAFILGVLPLAIATGAGANARRSLGITVLSGMLASTCLAVLFVPSFFAVLQRLDEARKGKTPPTTREKVSHEAGAKAAGA